MQIGLSSNYKSLGPFESEELNDFTVITGVNGSGKSQLLEQLKILASPKDPNEKSVIFVKPKLKRIHTEPLITENVSQGSPTLYRDMVIGFHSQYQMQIAAKRELHVMWQNLAINNVSESSLSKLEITDEKSLQLFRELLSTDVNVMLDQDIEQLSLQISNSPRPSGVHNAYRRVLDYLKKNIVTFEVSKIVSDYRNKGLFQLTQSDFFNSVIPEKYFDVTDLVNSRIENIFYSYLRKRSLNNYQFYRKERSKEINNSASPTKFEEDFPPPWRILNKLFESANLGYYFNDILDTEFSTDANIEFELRKKNTNQIIPFQNLSSGEKVIIGIILKLFSSEFYNTNLTYPELIFLDEPDAHLHPELTKVLIEVLNETFVKKFKIKVIITTHSPATVALAPSESIFQLINGPNTTLTKIEKDEALKLLTRGLPNLSIDYKNHRQVFVESPTDLKYYQDLYNKLKNEVKLVHPLYFIANGYGHGNCDQVVKLVGDLRQSGNPTSYGIVDWDNKELQYPFVHVHGKARRYSIENFIFDPIYLSILLLEKRYGELASHISHSESDNQYDLIKSAGAQTAINFITEKIKSKFSHKSIDVSPIQCHYGSLTFCIPKWYLMLDGHKLKGQIIKTFEPLHGLIAAGDYEVEKALINIMAKVFPFVPSETVDLLKTLALVDER
jgi:AAA15 family ATPase/GTPase